MNDTASLPLAIDVMGGDRAPASVIGGLQRSLDQFPDLRFRLYGRRDALGSLLERYPAVAQASEFIHCHEVVNSTDKPSHALRQGRDTSMRQAIEAVKAGVASGVVSAGNTGAFMAMSKVVLKTLPGISRPAIAGMMPNEFRNVFMLDLGANVYCDARELYEFALMGDAYAKAVLGIERPRIGLLNIGSEDMKGHDELRLAAAMLRDLGERMNFIGFVEGDDIFNSDVNVVITDGFSGNIALKSAEGTAFYFSRLLKQSLRSSWRGRLGAWIAKPAFAFMKHRLDPRQMNGAMFLGLDGIAVKSHGGADEIAFASAVRVAYELAKSRINEKIIQELALEPEDNAYTGATHIFANAERRQYTPS